MNVQSIICLTVGKLNLALSWLTSKTISTTLLLLALSTTSHAAENFYSNPTTPFPPGCATNYQIADQLPAKASDINSGVVHMKEADDAASLHAVDIRVWRRGCTEPGRSILMFDMSVIDDQDGEMQSVLVPMFKADRFGIGFGLRGVAEPNTWFSSGHSQRVDEGQTVTLFLDGISIYDDAFNANLVLTAEAYNGDFDLLVLDPRDSSGFRLGIPEYRDQHHAAELPLNGRLSGTWGVPGAPDQGFVLAFEELVHETTQHLFMSWYTFDQNGNLLWLTGGSRYALGESSVEFPITLVQDGTFMGTEPARRSEAGTGRIKAFGCNRLVLTYDLNAIGLGDGVLGLQRFYSMETAGYACRDAQARIEALD